MGRVKKEQKGEKGILRGTGKLWGEEKLRYVHTPWGERDKSLSYSV